MNKRVATIPQLVPYDVNMVVCNIKLGKHSIICPVADKFRPQQYLIEVERTVAV